MEEPTFRKSARMPRRGDLIVPPSKEPEGPAPQAPKPHQPAGWLSYLIVAILIAASFSPLLLSDLLWTSHDQIVRSGFQEMDTWTDAWTIDSIRRDDPITITSFFAEKLIPLPTPAVHRAVNIVIHILAALALIKVIDALKLFGARFAALLFALHPATVQTLFWPRIPR